MTFLRYTICCTLLFLTQGMSLTNTSPVVVPTRARKVGTVYLKL